DWRPHVEELAVAGAEIPPRRIDSLKNHRSLRQAQTASPVLLRDQRRHPARLGQSTDEVLGIGPLVVDVLPVRRTKLTAERSHRFPDWLICVVGHDLLLPEVKVVADLRNVWRRPVSFP